MALSALLAVGCGPNPYDPQRLSATGELVDGTTPRAGQSIERYELDFIVAGEAGEVTIERQFAASASGGAIATDEAGLFRIASEDLALSYDWERDELECVESCVTWETVCQEVTEEVCLDTCSELDCWEECGSECWEETVCDEEDCWTEVVCEEVCGEVCETVTYACDCHLETYEDCFDQCVETVEDCDWVTRTYTSQAALEDVIATEARVWLRDSQGTLHGFVGQPLEAQQHRTCNQQGECRLENLWIQRDRFIIDLP